MLLLVFAMSPVAWTQQQSAPVRHDPVLDQLTAFAQDFEHRVRAAGFKLTSVSPAIVVDTRPQLSMYTAQDNTIHSARWEDLPPEVQEIFKRWAAYAGDGTGKQLFDDSFHRFFFIHELAHVLERQAKVNTGNAYQSELEANRITVAYWREKDRAFLTALLAQFQRINQRLPVPVPPGQDVEQSFNANYHGSGSNPEVYGWFQTRMVLQAGAERPFRSFSETLHRLAVPPRKPIRD